MISQTISNQNPLFADDTILYRQIHTQQDCLLLQHDLQQLQRWEQHWQMSFHPDKCITIRFTRNKRYPIIHQYQLHNHTLTTQTNAKYLGITFSADLRWNTHIKNITTKANRTHGLDSSAQKHPRRIPYHQTKSVPGIGPSKARVRRSCMGPTNSDQYQTPGIRWTMSRHHNTSSVTAPGWDLYVPCVCCRLS